MPSDESFTPPFDLSAEYYRLRAGHERALAMIAMTEEQRAAHLKAANRWQELAERQER
jgi:hypothetical protein